MDTFEEILQALPRLLDGVRSQSDTLLANIAMVGEIPSPTFGEQKRIRFLEDRFSESGLQNCSIDEMGNGLAILPGTVEDQSRNILVVAHADTVFSRDVDHTVTIEPDTVTGVGVGDNSLGVAVVATLPGLLEALGIELRSNIILMGAVRSLGRGNLEGLRYFLAHQERPLLAGLCVEGTRLGRLNISSLGMLRGEIKVEIPDQHTWSPFGTMGAVSTLNQVINKINAIALPKNPRSSIILGSMHAGSTYHKIAQHALLKFEIQSESNSIVEEVREQMEDLVAEVASQSWRSGWVGPLCWT